MAKRTKKEKKVIEDEIFNVKKDGKEKTVRTEIFEEEKPASKEQVKKERKVFVGIVIAMASFILMFVVLYAVINLVNHFTIEGVKFELIKNGNLAFYKTSMPVIYNNTQTEYNFYLRTNPRVLENVPFNGKVIAKQNMVLNVEKNFDCDGDGVIAMANLLNLYDFIGTEVGRNENIVCDPSAKYMSVNIKEGKETKINQYGPICYDIEIKDCEILKGTEKFMFETFVELNQKLNE